jgi:hypothetical protein
VPVDGYGNNMSMMKEEIPGNEKSHPSAGSRMAKPDNYNDALGNPGRFKMQTEFIAQDKPGAALAAGKKQRMDAAGCDETYWNPCNTSCNHK